MSIVGDKENHSENCHGQRAFNRSRSLLTGKLNTELRGKKKLYKFYLKHCIVWLRELDTRKSVELRNVVLEENGEDILNLFHE